MNVKNAQRTLCLTIIFLFVHQAWAENWIYYGTNSVGDMYYDKSRIQEVNKSIISVWTKNILSEEAKTKYFSILKSIGKAPNNPSLLSYYTELLEIDFENKRIKNISVIFYNPKGNLIYSSPQSVSGQWNAILPGSVGDTLVDILSLETVTPKEAVVFVPSVSNQDLAQVKSNQNETKVIPKETAPILVTKTTKNSKSGGVSTYRGSENRETAGEKSKGNRPLVAVREKGRDGRFIAYDNQTVLDSSTNLMWAAKDNGFDINWRDAKTYCENYHGGGYTDWRMPTTDELARLYDRSKPQKQACYPKYEIYLTSLIDLSCCCPWASEISDSDAASFNFDPGRREWDPPSNEVNKWYRVLPVRSAR